MFEALKAPVSPPTALSKYTMLNGLLYLPSGMLLMIDPYVLEAVGYPPMTALTAGPVRGIGVCVIYIASFYLWGARSRNVPLALATAVNRIFLGPLLLLPLVYLKLLEPVLGIPFMILDVVLGLGMYLVWKRTKEPNHA